MTRHRSATAPALKERQEGRVIVVELCGDIDILARPTVTARLDALTASGRPHLVLDLRPVTFIDCSGLAVLCRVRQRVLLRGGRLGVVTDSPRVRRILRLADLSRAFPLHSSVHEAFLTVSPAYTATAADAAHGGGTEGAVRPVPAIPPV